MSTDTGKQKRCVVLFTVCLFWMRSLHLLFKYMCQYDRHTKSIHVITVQGGVKPCFEYDKYLRLANTFVISFAVLISSSRDHPGPPSPFRNKRTFKHVESSHVTNPLNINIPNFEFIVTIVGYLKYICNFHEMISMQQETCIL